MLSFCARNTENAVRGELVRFRAVRAVEQILLSFSALAIKLMGPLRLARYTKYPSAHFLNCS